MAARLRDVLRPWIPPAAIDIARRRRGSYAGLTLSDLNWAEALAVCDGYDDPVIFDSVERATRKAIASDGYERDGIVLEAGEVHWPILGPLFEARAATPGVLRVIDVGGSLASKWFQHRQFHAALAPVAWAVVEQAHVVGAAREWLETDQLSFHASVSEARTYLEGADVMIFSSSLHYLPQPMAALREAASVASHSVVIDRVPSWNEPGEHVAIQSVGLYSKPVRYPCWVMSRPSMLRALEESFEIVTTGGEAMPFSATPASARIGWWGVFASGSRA